MLSSVVLTLRKPRRVRQPNFVVALSKNQKVGQPPLLIVDDCDKATKAGLQNSFRQMRGTPRISPEGAHSLSFIHDDIYFGDSKFSVGIQLADLCSFFIAKHLIGDDPVAETFYQQIEPAVVHYEISPREQSNAGV
jgi:hypothetical protein